MLLKHAAPVKMPAARWHQGRSAKEDGDLRGSL